MTTKPKPRTNLPLYRLGFAPRTGVAANGQPTLGYPVEIGAVFSRKDAEKGLIAKFSIIPADLKDGVMLLMPVRAKPDLLSNSEGTAQ
jgi:hypothetical protein